MARDWPHLPQYNSSEEALPTLPDGWSISQVSELYDQLPVGKRFEQKSTLKSGLVPVIDQSADGIIGWHNEVPGVEANVSAPVITFANHTCEMRVMRRPFSVIQNVFPLVGRRGVCTTLYLYYLTKGRVWLEEYKGHYPDYRRKWVPLPTLDEQRAIASILGALDDKIELNRKMSANLEAIARALFKSWFVDFDPVHAKAEGRDPGLPAEIAGLFPDSFEETAHGQIPNGWAPRKLLSVCSLVERGITPQYESGSGILIINQKVNRGSILDLKALKELSRELVIPTEKLTRQFDVLVNCLGEGTLGRVHLFRGRPAYAVDQHMAICRPSVQSFGPLIYERLASPEGQAIIEASKTGTTGMTMLNISKLREFPLLWPSNELAIIYGQIVTQFWQRINLNEEMSENLARLRDALLPKLISGELRVGEAERVLAASA